MDSKNEFGTEMTNAGSTRSRLRIMAIKEQKIIRGDEWAPAPLVYRESMVPPGFVQWVKAGRPEQ